MKIPEIEQKREQLQKQYKEIQQEIYKADADVMAYDEAMTNTEVKIYNLKRQLQANLSDRERERLNHELNERLLTLHAQETSYVNAGGRLREATEKLKKVKSELNRIGS